MHLDKLRDITEELLHLVYTAYKTEQMYHTSDEQNVYYDIIQQWLEDYKISTPRSIRSIHSKWLFHETRKISKLRREFLAKECALLGTTQNDKRKYYCELPDLLWPALYMYACDEKCRKHTTLTFEQHNTHMLLSEDIDYIIMDPLVYLLN